MNEANDTSVTIDLAARTAEIDRLAAQKGKTRADMVLTIIDAQLAFSTMVARLHEAECGDTTTCEHSGR